MMHQRRHMQMMSNTMTTKLLVHEVAEAFCVVRNQFTYLAELHSWFTSFNGCVHRFSCNFAKFVNFRMNFYLVSLKHYHSRVIAMMSLLKADYIDVEVVTCL